jgi:uncharacterized membrane protein
METTKRSIAKTISWRITGSGATFLVVWVILGDMIISGSIATIQLVMNTVLYYIHERLWNGVKWGRE